LIARRSENIIKIQQEIDEFGGKAISLPGVDVSSEVDVKKAFEQIHNTIGPTNVLIYNAAARRFKKQSITDVTTEEFINFWKINCLGAFYATREVVPFMRKQGHGTILLTGATSAMRGLDGMSSFSVGKFGLRSLGQSLARELSPQGIHVVHVIVDGPVDVPLVRHVVEKQGPVPPDFFMEPDHIADQYWNLYQQPNTVWTQEIDLRPYKEQIYSAL